MFEVTYQKKALFTPTMILDFVESGINKSKWIANFDYDVYKPEEIQIAKETAGIFHVSSNAVLAVLGGKYNIKLSHPGYKNTDGEFTTKLDKDLLTKGLSILAQYEPFRTSLTLKPYENEEYTVSELAKYGDFLLQCCVFGQIRLK